MVSASSKISKQLVSILVVMEFSLLDNPPGFAKHKLAGFNPCCNGIQSVGPHDSLASAENIGFNPCCNGIQSVGPFKSFHFFKYPKVSILVVMEFSLLVVVLSIVVVFDGCFNPCCNGIQSVG